MYQFFQKHPPPHSFFKLTDLSSTDLTKEDYFFQDIKKIFSVFQT